MDIAILVVGLISIQATALIMLNDIRGMLKEIRGMLKEIKNHERKI